MYFPLKISIPEPCNEDWNKMTPVEINRRHCQSCEKVVTDFTNMTDLQIGNHLRAHGGKVCGRFRKSQLDRRIKIGGPRRFSGLRAAAAATGLLFSLPIVAQNVPAKPITYIETGENKSPATNSTNPGEPLQKGYITIRSQITDHGGESLIGARVLLEGTTIGTVTDIDGLFVLTVPADSSANLKISYTGFATETVTIPMLRLQTALRSSSNESSDDLTLQLDPIACEESPAGGISYRRHPSLLENLMVHTVKPIYVGISHAGRAKYGDWKDYWREKFAKAKARRVERRKERALRRAARQQIASTVPPKPVEVSASPTPVTTEKTGLRLTTSPNPFTDHFRVSFELPKDQAYSLELTSATGQIIIRKTGKGESGLQQVELRDNVSTLPAGTYFLRLQTEDGQMLVKTLIH